MSLPNTDPSYVPKETARVAKAIFPKGNLAIHLRDELDVLYTEDLFADLYPVRGKPSEAPWRLALVTVLQFAEDLTDREAADAVRRNIDWKYALGLELTDTGFSHSVLSKFRKRLIEGQAEHRLLDALLEACKAKGLIKKRGSARTDSTHVLAKVRALNRLGSCVETMRLVLNELAIVVPEWLQSWVPTDWFDLYGPRFHELRLPKGKDKIKALLVQVGKDGYCLLNKLYSSDLTTDSYSIEFLRQKWLQTFYFEQDELQLRERKNRPPYRDLLLSPYDPDARMAVKRDIRWTGYKVHVTESCDEDSVHLITHVETSPAPRYDNQVIPSVHQGLKEKELLPELHLVDAGYMDTKLLLDSKTEYGVCLHGPILKGQKLHEDTYFISDFEVDWQKQKASCPQGKQSISWKETLTSRGNPMIRVSFSTKDCRPCEYRKLCTKAKTQARMLGFAPKEQFDALNQARQDQKTDAWKTTYKARAGIEGTLSQGIRAFGLRRSRYFGFAKTHLQQQLTATAINVSRLTDWFNEKPRAKTRVSRFQSLKA